MKTLDLSEAAILLKMSTAGVRRKAACGEIPGAKPGRRWVFREDDLLEYLRSLYTAPARASLHTPMRDTQWRFTNEAIRGGSVSATTVKEYRKALGLPIE